MFISAMLLKFYTALIREGVGWKGVRVPCKLIRREFAFLHPVDKPTNSKFTIETACINAVVILLSLYVKKHSMN